MQGKHVIIGVHVTERLKNAAAVQAVFTEFGCNIKTRLGLHDVDGNTCAPGGVVLLEFYGDDDAHGKMLAALQAIDGVEVQTMVFDQ